MTATSIAAIARLFHRALPVAEQPAFLDRWLLAALADVYRRTGQPVRAVAISTAVGKDDRWCRRQLSHMERRGLVQRVGQRKGWLPSATTMLHPTPQV